MQEVKDTQRALVRIGYDGRVHKTFRGPLARERFENEVRVLRHLEARGCEFVPRVLEADPENLYLVTTNCGGLPDLVEEGESGFLVEPGNREQLLSPLERLIVDAELRRAMGLRGREIYQEKQATDVVVKKIDSVYASLTQNALVN